MQISQVLLNLFNNSFDAIENSDTKWIKHEVVYLENFARLEISDSGSGIQKALADKIMQPFFTTKPIGKGTGLGLSISRSIIEEHGGKFFLDETCPNTKFIIELPYFQQKKN